MTSVQPSTGSSWPLAIKTLTTEAAETRTRGMSWARDARRQAVAEEEAMVARETAATRRVSGRVSASAAHNGSTAASPRPTITDTAFRNTRTLRRGSGSESGASAR